MNDRHMKMLAAFEQAGAFLNLFATFLFSYHKSLCDAGFQPAESLVLVKKMQTIMFKNAFSGLKPGSDDEDNDSCED